MDKMFVRVPVAIKAKVTEDYIKNADYDVAKEFFCYNE